MAGVRQDSLRHARVTERCGVVVHPTASERVTRTDDNKCGAAVPTKHSGKLATPRIVLDRIVCRRAHYVAAPGMSESQLDGGSTSRVTEIHGQQSVVSSGAQNSGICRGTTPRRCRSARCFSNRASPAYCADSATGNPEARVKDPNPAGIGRGVGGSDQGAERMTKQYQFAPRLVGSSAPPDRQRTHSRSNQGVQC